MAGRRVDGRTGRKRRVCILGQTRCETIRVQKRGKLTWSTKIVYFSLPLSNVISYDDVKQNLIFLTWFASFSLFY